MKKVLQLYYKKTKKINALPQKKRKNLQERITERVKKISDSTNLEYKLNVETFSTSYEKAKDKIAISKVSFEANGEKENKREIHIKKLKIQRQNSEDKKEFRRYLDKILDLCVFQKKKK